MFNRFQQGQCTLEEWISKSTKVVDYQGGKSTRVVDRGLPGTRHGQEEILHRRARCPIVSWPWKWTWRGVAAHLPCLHRRGSEKLGPCWCMTHPAAAWQLPAYSSTSTSNGRQQLDCFTPGNQELLPRFGHVLPSCRVSLPCKLACGKDDESLMVFGETSLTDSQKLNDHR